MTEPQQALCGRCGKPVTRDRDYIWSHVDSAVQHPPKPPIDRVVDLITGLLLIGLIFTLIGLLLLPIALMYYWLS